MPEGTNPAELIFYPFAYALFDEERYRFCWFCLREKHDVDDVHTLKKCSGCECAHFCDAVCQRRGWFDHKAECHAIRKAQGMPDVEVRMLGEL